MKIKFMFRANIQGLALSLTVPSKINPLKIVHTLIQTETTAAATATAAIANSTAITFSTIFEVLPEFSLKIQIPKSLTEVLYIAN